MRYFTIILALLFSLNAAPAHAMDAITGTVLSLNRETGEMTVSGATEETLNVSFSPDRLPGCIQVGGVVRLWGEFGQKNSYTFHAEHIRGGGRMQGNDPTGVRSRLGGRGKTGGGGRHSGKGGRGQ